MPGLNEEMKFDGGLPAKRSNSEELQVQRLRERFQELRFHKIARCLCQAASFKKSQIDPEKEREDWERLTRLEWALAPFITIEWEDGRD